MGVCSGSLGTDPGEQNGICLFGIGIGVEFDVNVSIPHMSDATDGVGGCCGVAWRITWVPISKIFSRFIWVKLVCVGFYAGKLLLSH